MNNKELLELAAKAAGIDAKPHGNTFYVDKGHLGLVEWNPLIDDGDALRLAVKLHMFDFPRVFYWRLEEIRINPKRSDVEIFRRAIVLVAAEIGKNKN